MDVTIAETPEQIAACHPLMVQLRPHLERPAFVEQVLRQQQHGYRLCFMGPAAAPVAIAGFHLGESLAWGRYLYLDDLTTAEPHRSRGHGKTLLQWLRDHARQQGCGQLHLDCGLPREAAQRFYRREGLQAVAYHYYQELHDHA